MKDKIRNIIQISKDYFYNKYENIINYLLLKKNRKRNLRIIGSLIVVLLFVLVVLSSNAYYHDTNSMELIHSKVGNVRNDSFDYILYVFIEESKGTGIYKLVDSIPTSNYSYDRYSCDNGSVFNYDSVNMTTTAILNEREVCRIYFNLNS